MTSTPLQILVVESEPLIALDIERMVTESIPAASQILVIDSLPFDRPDATFDLVICSIDTRPEPTLAALRTIARSGAAIVAVGTSQIVPGVDAFGWPQLEKPFSQAELLDAIQRALASRQCGTRG